MSKFILTMIVSITIIIAGCQKIEDVELSNESNFKSEEVTPKKLDDYKENNEISSEIDTDLVTVIEEDDQSTIDSNSITEDDIYKLLKNQGLKCDEALIESYTNILNSEASFISKNYGSGVDEIITLQDLELAEDAPMYPICYSLVDMNNDEVPELLTGVTTGGSYFTIVLYSNEGKVRSYWFSNRQLNELKSDGTFHSSGGAGYYRIDRIDFIEDDYKLIELACFNAGSKLDDEGNVIIKYYLNQDEVSKSEFETYMDAFNEKTDAIWVDIVR